MSGQRTWSLKLPPTLLGLAILLFVFLADTVAAIGIGARNAWVRREQSRIRVRLDSLEHRRAELERLERIHRALVKATSGRIPQDQALLLVQEIDRNARLYDFDPLLILAVVLTESGGQFQAVGRTNSGAVSGAQGVMQVQPITARAMASALGWPEPKPGDLMDPSFNISIGVAFLLQMVHHYGDLRLGIIAYNVGPAALESKLRGQTPLPDGYYRTVLAHYRRLRGSVPESSS